MGEPVAAPVSSAPIAGLFGKLPAHGDFVRRGWSDETIEAVDRWLTEAVGAVRESRDDEAFGDWMRAAPLWRGFVPAGALGPHALHLAVAPSIDRAGRLFPVVAGIAGAAADAWRHAGSAGAAVDAAIYDALAGHADADATVDAIAASLAAPAARANRIAAPAESAWWLAPDGEPDVAAASVDAALLTRLWREGQG